MRLLKITPLKNYLQSCFVDFPEDFHFIEKYSITLSALSQTRKTFWTLLEEMLQIKLDCSL